MGLLAILAMIIAFISKILTIYTKNLMIHLEGKNLN